jgi:radical SAM protein with 4Fe4S-binding SPASM domain
MLRQLLHLIVSGEMTSRDECAARLGVSAESLDEMIGRLVALGYLENASASCASSAAAGGAKGGACKGCSMAGSCHGGCFADRKGIAWAVTAKGRSAEAPAADSSSSES